MRRFYWVSLDLLKQSKLLGHPAKGWRDLVRVEIRLAPMKRRAVK